MSANENGAGDNAANNNGADENGADENTADENTADENTADTPREDAGQAAEDQQSGPSSSLWQWAPKIIALVVLVTTGGVLFYFFGDQLSLEAIKKYEDSILEFQQQQPVLIIAIAFVIYVTVTSFSLPGAAAMTMVYGWLFRNSYGWLVGFPLALLLVSFASTSGATFAFLSSRYIFGSSIQQKFGEKLKTFNQALEQEGPFYLFTLRLVPAFPFFVINVVMGLTRIRTGAFWWVSQLGMLPGTCVFTFAGASAPSFSQLAEDGAGSVLTWPLILAFVLLGVFPLLVKQGVKLLGKGKAAPRKQA